MTDRMDSEEWERVVLRQQSQKATAEARAVLDRLKNEEPRLVADISARREHRMFVEPEIPQPEPALNNAQRRVMESHQRQRPPLDPATMALWDAWFDQRCEASMNPKLQKIVKAIAAKANSNTAINDRNVKGLDADILKLRKEFQEGFASLRKAMRDEYRKEFDVEFQKLKKDMAEQRRDVAIVTGIARGQVARLRGTTPTKVPSRGRK